MPKASSADAADSESPVSAFGPVSGCEGRSAALVPRLHRAWAAQRRPRKMAMRSPWSDGEKWCRRCDETSSPTAAFAVQRPVARRTADATAGTASRGRVPREADGCGQAVVRPPDIPDGPQVLPKLPHDEATDRVRSATARAERRADVGLSKPCRSRARIASGSPEAAVRHHRAPRSRPCARRRVGCVRSAGRRRRSTSTTTTRPARSAGMLCFSCNAALGHFKDEPTVLRRAARYLDDVRGEGRTGTVDVAPRRGGLGDRAQSPHRRSRARVPGAAGSRRRTVPAGAAVRGSARRARWWPGVLTAAVLGS